MMQPTIAPLFKTRPFEDSLLKWTGNKTSYDDFFKQYWTAKLGGYNAYEKALQDGVIDRVAGPAPVPAAAATYLNAATNVSPLPLPFHR